MTLPAGAPVGLVVENPPRPPVARPAGASAPFGGLAEARITAPPKRTRCCGSAAALGRFISDSTGSATRTGGRLDSDMRAAAGRAGFGTNVAV